MTTSLLERFGRRLRIGMVGGGSDSIIGETHRYSLRVDGLYELVAGALSVDPAIAVSSAAALLLDPARSYTDYRVMAEAEAARPDGIDVVTICTPPNLHAEVARTFLARGIDVICEKPLTGNHAEALDLVAAVRRSGRALLLTHCYTGYPVVRQARALVQAGAIGEIRLVEADFLNGGFLTEEPDRAKRHWRFRPETVGPGAILGEVGSHAINMACYVTGLPLAELSADLRTFTPGREVYDDARINLRFANGAVGRSWITYVAAGVEHGLGFRVFGETGSLHWNQEQPEALWFKRAGRAAELVTPGHAWLADEAQRASRIRGGHPEGYLMAFANLYRDFAHDLLAARLGEPVAPAHAPLPTVEDGEATMKFYDAALASHERGGAWVDAAPETRAEQGGRP